MEMFDWLKPIVEDKIYRNKMLSVAAGENQLIEFTFNEGITYQRERTEKEIESLKEALEVSLKLITEMSTLFPEVDKFIKDLDKKINKEINK